MVLLARTESEAQAAWVQLQAQFAALRLVVSQEKSRLTTLRDGFAFLGSEFRLHMWPREKARRNIRQRMRDVERTSERRRNLSGEWSGHKQIAHHRIFRIGGGNSAPSPLSWRNRGGARTRSRYRSDRVPALRSHTSRHSKAQIFWP